MKKIIGYLIGVILLTIIVVVLIVWIKSPGTPDAIRDKDGNTPENAISTIDIIPVGGIQQTIVIRGEDKAKPVLLMLHGGPGSPEFPFMKNVGLNLEQEFVVAHWEQRGAGKSYFEDIPAESMTMAQMISDAVEVTAHLQTRFDQDKIYLMGHSWGTFLGTHLANQHPSLFHSYVGIGQISRQFYGEQISFEWVKEAASTAGNQTDIEALNALTFPDSLSDNDTWMSYLQPQRVYVNKYGGGLKHKDYSMLDIYKTIIFDTPEYTIQDKLNYLNGVLFSASHLWDDVIQANFSQEIDSIAIPVHIFQGVHDYQTPYAPAKSFFDQLKAPEKYFHRFDHSAHSPFFDEPEKFNRIVREQVLIQK